MLINGEKVKILVGIQRFFEGKIDIEIGERIVSCDMCMDKDGEVGFIYNEEEYYLKDIE